MKDRSQDKSEGGIFKPNGLWVSVEGDRDWKSWCESENWGSERSDPHEVTLSAAANVLRITTLAEFDAFNGAYGSRLDYGQVIIWPNVARDYDGIIIAPYHYERRYGDESLWYYGWDCASGCVWRAAAVESILALPNDDPAWMKFTKESAA